MAGVRTIVIDSISSGLSPRGSSCDLGLCSGPSYRRPSSSLISTALRSSFVGDWPRRRRPLMRSKKKQWRRGGVIVDELAGQYEEGFDDIHVQLMNFFTYKAVTMVLHQLYDMNPPQYILFYRNAIMQRCMKEFQMRISN